MRFYGIENRIKWDLKCRNEDLFRKKRDDMGNEHIKIWRFKQPKIMDSYRLNMVYI